MLFRSGGQHRREHRPSLVGLHRRGAKCSRAAGGQGRADRASPRRRRGPRRPVPVSPGLDGLTRSRSVPMVSTATAAGGLSSLSRAMAAGPGEARTATSSRSCSRSRALSRCIFDASNVGTSCQTHSVAAGKHEVSMGSTVLEVHHRDVDGSRGTSNHSNIDFHGRFAMRLA